MTVRAADARRVDVPALRAELVLAIEAALRSASLPAGRAEIATAVHRAGALVGGGRGVIVNEVATGIARAVSGTVRRG